jgi:mannose-1-phosphate guanylyltransferase
MKAMILAAGLGTRLDPLTTERPKALMPIANIPVIDHIIEYLTEHGVSGIVVNAHHHQERLVRHLTRDRAFGVPVQVRVEPEILGTGGGIKNTEDFWDDAPFIVINVDILTDIDLTRAYEAHLKEGALATMVLHDCSPFNQIMIDREQNIRDIAVKELPGRLAFTGIHILDPRLLAHIPGGVFTNIIDCYRRLMEKEGVIKAWVCSGHYWRDIGTVESYVLANREAMGPNSRLISPDCRIHPSAVTEDWAVIGPGTVLEEGARVCRSVLWENVTIGKGARVVDSIVTASKSVTSDLVKGIL